MTHQRTEIRNAIVSLLTGATDAGSNVFNSPSSNLFQSSLPAVFVYLQDEEPGEKTTGGNPLQVRTAFAKIQVLAEATTDAAAITAVEDICKQIEDLLETENVNEASDLGPKIKDLALAGVRSISKKEGEKQAAGLELSYAMKYVTRYNTAS